MFLLNEIISVCFKVEIFFDEGECDGDDICSNYLDGQIDRMLEEFFLDNKMVLYRKEIEDIIVEICIIVMNGSMNCYDYEFVIEL